MQQKVKHIDVSCNLDTALMATGRYIQEFSDLYPNINSWFGDKVVPGVKDKTRIILLVIVNEDIIGIAIGKKGKSTKLCTMHVDEDFRGLGLGDLLLKNILEFARLNSSRSLHFTISEETNSQLENYFKLRNFDKIGWVSNRYRKTIDEFTWKGNLSTIRVLPQLVVEGMKMVSVYGNTLSVWENCHECKNGISEGRGHYPINSSKMGRTDIIGEEKSRVSKSNCGKINNTIKGFGLYQQPYSGYRNDNISLKYSQRSNISDSFFARKPILSSGDKKVLFRENIRFCPANIPMSHSCASNYTNGIKADKKRIYTPTKLQENIRKRNMPIIGK